MTTDTDILVAGAGLAGRIAALMLARAGWQVVLADPGPIRTPDTPDPRTTAVMASSFPALDALGLRAALAQVSAPLKVMRIVDAAGPGKPVTADFAAADIGLDAFALNLPNEPFRDALGALMADTPNLKLAEQAPLTALTTRTDRAFATLGDGRRVTARLVIGADGRDSAVRRLSGIGVAMHRYGQAALSFIVGHDHPHRDISTEVHDTGGPFTLVPLPDADTGAHRSSVVWMDRGPAIRGLRDLDATAFSAAATARSCEILGQLRLEGTVPPPWPMQSMIAGAFHGQRVALIAEAAHAVPPIGAQGLNMSLADILALIEEIGEPGGDPGRADALAAYGPARHRTAALRVAGIDALNRASMAGLPGVAAMRRELLRALYGAAPFRRAVMRAGVGPGLFGPNRPAA